MANAEREASLSVMGLQVGILLALYELGHGLYPASYLTIRSCARYAHALGINVSWLVPAKPGITLMETEERLRVGWAILILDR